MFESVWKYHCQFLAFNSYQKKLIFVLMLYSLNMHAQLTSGILNSQLLQRFKRDICLRKLVCALAGYLNINDRLKFASS